MDEIKTTIQQLRNRLRRLIKLVETEVRENEKQHKEMLERMKDFDQDLYKLSVDFQYMIRDIDRMDNSKLLKEIDNINKDMEKIKNNSIIDQLIKSIRTDWKSWIAFISIMVMLILYIISTL
jgi:DNA repair exonuclease SbcCD ATPase subunit